MQDIQILKRHRAKKLYTTALWLKFKTIRGSMKIQIEIETDGGITEDYKMTEECQMILKEIGIFMQNINKIKKQFYQTENNIRNSVVIEKNTQN